MNVTLIMPPFPSRKPKAIEYGHEQARPLSLFYLAANLEKHGHPVEIIDFQKSVCDDDYIRQTIKKRQSPIFGITGLTDMRFEAINVVRIIKEIHPGSFVIAGGHHFSKCAIDTLENVRWIDAICTCDGEEVIVELADAVKDGRSPEGIKGIIYRKENEIKDNGQRAPADLNSLPYYTRFEYDEYPEYLMYYPKRVRALSVLSSRGCPYDCIFCTVGRTPYLKRKPSAVVDEIEYYKKRFRIEAVNFFDYNLTVNESYVRELCAELKERRSGIKWWCDSRVNIPLDLLEVMKDAGCVWVSIGVETGSNAMLKNISKRINLEQVTAYIDKCRQIGIGITMLLMISHPGETRQDFMQTYEFLKKVNPKIDILGFGVTTIYPGAEIERIAREKNIIPPDFSWSKPFESEVSVRLLHYPNIPAFIDKLSVEEIDGFRKKLTVMSMKKREIIRRMINLALSPSRWDVLNFRKQMERIYILFNAVKRLFSG